LINQKIFQALRKELSKSRIYELIQEIREKSGKIISNEDAANLLASSKGIDVAKILDEKELEKLINLKQSINIDIKPQKITRKIIKKDYVLQLGTKYIIKDPILPIKIINESENMVKIYQLFYLFENSIREFIKKVLNKNYGNNWWDNKVSKKIKDKVKDRKNKELKIPWHGKRGAHPIYYTDIEHLKRIINKNWPDFGPLLNKQDWINSLIDTIEHSRNVIAHNNPLHSDDIDRIKVNYKDWIKFLNSIKNKL